MQTAKVLLLEFHDFRSHGKKTKFEYRLPLPQSLPTNTLIPSPTNPLTFYLAKALSFTCRNPHLLATSTLISRIAHYSALLFLNAAVYHTRYPRLSLQQTQLHLPAGSSLLSCLGMPSSPTRDNNHFLASCTINSGLIFRPQVESAPVIDGGLL